MCQLSDIHSFVGYELGKKAVEGNVFPVKMVGACDLNGRSNIMDALRLLIKVF